MRPLKTLLLLLALLALDCPAQDAPAYQLGRDYEFVNRQAPVTDPKRIQVEEFFLYACPHCFAHEPPLRQWLQHKPADVDFIPVANSLGRRDGEVQERAYYIAVTLGITGKTHQAMFEAIHVLHKPLNTLESIRDFYVASAGIKPADFDGLANSFVVNAAVQRAEDLATAYGITETPSFVAGGRYRVRARANPADTFAVLDYVIARLRQERGLPPPRKR